MTERSATNCFHSLGTRAPLNLSRVSKLWQEIALNTPNLWVAIDVMNIGLAPTFLERSWGVALEIAMESGSMYDEGGSDDGEEPERATSERRGVQRAYDSRRQDPCKFIMPLLPHIDRWWSLTLEVLPTGEPLEGFLLPLAPALTTFCALELGGPPVLMTLHPDLFNQRLPNLSRLSLVGVVLPLGLAPTALKGLRWLTLTSGKTGIHN
ncbi:hypothetical protein BOTBODRAFT_175277 [Botryobasidium botryosum FD-172 SS1]|uniref:F-box domain-containing protein n=1 Tax=Botryobasidium botryosum (strain FD-172 SS1) TaxID=930990 RepID=A0A067MQL6_BOTB1|nr:hypothetical protein BOTBODRAFT_175277 [Botryobasidium botryosum FD-172 SS1]